MPTKPPTYEQLKRDATRPIRRLPSPEQRGNSAARGYGSQWRKRRRVYLRAHPLCVACLAGGRTCGATEVDHITPKARGGVDLEWNYQALCKSCHSSKTRRENRSAESHAHPDAPRNAVVGGDE